MRARRLSKIVPVRVSREDTIALRRWAREDRGEHGEASVSAVIRKLIEERRQREAVAA